MLNPHPHANRGGYTNPVNWDSDHSDNEVRPQASSQHGHLSDEYMCRLVDLGQSPKRRRPRRFSLLSEPEDDDLTNNNDSPYSPKKRQWSSRDTGYTARELEGLTWDTLRNAAEGSTCGDPFTSPGDFWRTPETASSARSTQAPLFINPSVLSRRDQALSASSQAAAPGISMHRAGQNQASRRLWGSPLSQQDIMHLLQDGAAHHPNHMDLHSGANLTSSSTHREAADDTNPINAIVQTIRTSNPLKACLHDGEGPSVLFAYRKESPSSTLCSPVYTVSENKLLHPAMSRSPPYHIQPISRPAGSRSKLHSSAKQSPSWPSEQLPVEIYELIANQLSRDDVKNMRLVNREFEQRISRVLFSTVVVPFNTEIYGMLNLSQQARKDRKGKGKEVDNYYLDPSNTLVYLNWRNAKSDQLYTGHGIDVFRGFGPHIRKYGMSFDVSEDALATPPPKVTQEEHSTFWGTYQWPFRQYRRFADRAGLEHTADETRTMTSAFSYLSAVNELALSLDSGLGWLQGPDVSFRQLIFKELPAIFAQSTSASDSTLKALKFWGLLKKSYQMSGFPVQDLKYATLWRYSNDNVKSQSTSSFIEKVAEGSPTVSMDPSVVAGAMPEDLTAVAESSGILYTMPGKSNGEIGQGTTSRIAPKSLTKAQKEWLLETEWAQRAFLLSYMLSVVDNKFTFRNVTTFNVARLSSRYLPLICREDFWDALPFLSNVTLKVIPDWRTVIKQDSGIVETVRIDPSNAISPFRTLLMQMVAPRKTITSLHLGWASGGERAEGVCARNKHILPIPLVDRREMFLARENFNTMLHLPYVEHLTFSNCWTTPHILLAFVDLHKDFALTKLTFDSVSLTADTSVPATQAVNQAMIQAVGNVVPPAVAQVMFQAMGQTGTPNNVAHPPGSNNFPNLNNHALHASNFMVPALPPPTVTNHPAAPPSVIPMHFHAHNHALGTPYANMHFHAHSQALGTPYANFHTFHPMGAQVMQNGQAPNIPHLPPQTQPLPPAFQPQINWNPNPPLGPALPTWNRARPNTWAKVIKQIRSGMQTAEPSSSSSKPHADLEDSDTPPPAPQTSLKTLVFRSCGYVKLPSSAPFDQHCLSPPTNIPGTNDPYFEKRAAALGGLMLSSSDVMLGTIVQWIDEGEKRPLEGILGMRSAAGDDWMGYVGNAVGHGYGGVGVGVAAGDAEGKERRDKRDKERTGWTPFERESVEFDGLAKGGTGRFSGVWPNVQDERDNV